MKRIFEFFNQHYIFFLVLVVLVSYGQMLFMQPWQDDNALFFKLTHINEGVGYFGQGPIGIGITKYTPTPFIPIHYLFGTKPIAYFAFLLGLYAISTICIYKVFSFILGEAGGKVVGFMLAAGYIASDGIWRMANSVTTSLSLITISLLLFAYWKFYREKKLQYYFLALLAFFLATEFAVNRTHYLFVLPALFEILFLAFRKPIWSVIISAIRLLPFFYIFKNMALIASSNRTPQMQEYLLAFVDGKWDLYYGFFGSVTNLVLPDWLTNYFVQFVRPAHFLIALLGIVIIFAGMVLFFALKNRKLFLFLSLWLLTNIVVYSAFNPTVQYAAVERYMIHSFLAFSGILGILFVALPNNNFFGKLGRILIVMLGVGNLYHSVVYQQNILQTRSFPTREFYSQLKGFLPAIKKGDVLYFDIARDTQERYNDAVATAQMPETTAFAWRYGNIDRYDISLTTNLDELTKIIKTQKTPISNIYAFWYSEEGLADTTSQLRAVLEGQLEPQLAISGLPSKSATNFIDIDNGTYWQQQDVPILLEKPVVSIAPIELTLEISTVPFSGDIDEYPLVYQNFSLPPTDKTFWSDSASRRLSLEYMNHRNSVRQSSKFSAASWWQDNIARNLGDGDLNTVWQGERTGWGRENTFIEIKLPFVQEVGSIVWVNGNSQNTPIDYNIAVSENGEDWQTIKSVQGGPRIDNTEPQVLSFVPVKTLYIRMVLTKTLNGDSPVIAEFWPIPSRLSALDIRVAERFVKEPLVFVATKEAFLETLAGLDSRGKIQLVWQSNKRDDWQSSQQTEFNILYDGRPREYKIIVPASGTEISKLKLTHTSLPGTITLHSVKAKYLDLLAN